eukprot:16435194-Heterocapsa_arctica.AAC.1
MTDAAGHSPGWCTRCAPVRSKFGLRVHVRETSALKGISCARDTADNLRLDDAIGHKRQNQ